MRTADVMMWTAVIWTAVMNRSAVMLLKKSGTSLSFSSVAMMRTAVMRTPDVMMWTEVYIRTAVVNRSAVMLLKKSGSCLSPPSGSMLFQKACGLLAILA